jgi:hypothetical protein
MDGDHHGKHDHSSRGSVLASGVFYSQVPPGSGAIRFFDARAHPAGPPPLGHTRMAQRLRARCVGIDEQPADSHRTAACTQARR